MAQEAALTLMEKDRTLSLPENLSLGAAVKKKFTGTVNKISLN